MKKQIGFEELVRDAKEEMRSWPPGLKEATQLEGSVNYAQDVNVAKTQESHPNKKGVRKEK